eukprot:3775227-Rhodomonas_salina.1
MELYRLAAIFSCPTMIMAAVQIIMGRLSEESEALQIRRRKMMRLFSGFSAQMIHTAAMPRQHTRKHKHALQKRMADWDDVAFKERFQFRKSEVDKLMKEWDLLDANGNPKRLCVGSNGVRAYLNAETCVLLMFRHMAFPCRLVDLQVEFGLSLAMCSYAFNYMISYIYREFAALLNDISLFTQHFDQWASTFDDAGCPFSHTIRMLDGHFVPTCRPGGDGN